MDKQKKAIHSLLATNKVLRSSLQADAMQVMGTPTDPVLLMAWNEGRRSKAAEFISIYNEVEADIHGHST